MKIFISWSGDKSKEIASVFKDWIPAVIQAAKPYFSPNDIDKGARWSNEIAKELEESRIGLICLTDDNLQAPWLMFEAGALSKSMDKARVCPMLFGIEATDLSGPLVQFQATPFSKDEVYKVIKMINAQLGELALASSVVDSVFEKWWPDLDDKVKKALSKERKKSGSEIRSDRDLLEEVLKISRTLSEREPASRGERTSFVTSRTIAEHIDRMIDFASEIVKESSDAEVLTKTRDYFEKSMITLFKRIPEESEYRRHLGSRANDVLGALQSKLQELDDIPF